MPEYNQSRAALIHLMSEPDSRTLKDAVWSILREHPKLVNEQLTDTGETIVHLAAAQGYHKHLLDSLVHGYQIQTNLNAKDKKGRTPLLVSAEHGQTDAFKLLASSQNYQQEAASIVDAATRGQLQTVAIPNRPSQEIDRDIEGNTALHLAVANDKAEMVALLSHKAYLSLQNNAGQTSLHIALEQRKQVANQLINAIKHLEPQDSSALVNIADKNGNTPLLLAAKNGKLNFIQELLAMGAAWNAVSNDGMSILHHSAGGTAQQVAKVQELVTHALQSPQKMRQQNARELIAQQNKEGQTALHIAFETDDLKFAEFLIKQKINLNAQDKNGKTALHLAAEKNNLALVDLLLKNGADPRIVNKAGKTPAQLSQSDSIIQSCNHYAEHMTALDNNEKVFIDTLLKLGFDKDPNPKSIQTILLQFKRDELPLEQRYHNAGNDLKELFKGVAFDVKPPLEQMMKLIIPDIINPKKVVTQDELVKWLHILVEKPPAPLKAPLTTIAKEFSNLNYRHTADVRKDMKELEELKTAKEASKAHKSASKPTLEKVREAENRIAHLEKILKFDQIKLLVVEKAELRALSLKLSTSNEPPAAKRLVDAVILEKRREIIKATSAFSAEEKESVKAFEEAILNKEKLKLTKDQLITKFPDLKKELDKLGHQAAPSSTPPFSAAAAAGRIGLLHVPTTDAPTAEPPTAKNVGNKSH